MSDMSTPRHRDGDGATDTAASSLANSTRNNAALGMIGGTFVSIMALTTPFVFMQLRSSLPYMATPRSKVEKALKFVSQRASASATASNIHHMESKSIHTMKQPQLPNLNNAKLNFVDLGSGDGTTILAAASLNYNATGFELNPTLWFISSIRRILSIPSSVIRNNSQFILGDMFTNNVAKRKLNEANCVMIFGVLPLMPKIANLVQSACQPGCYLMSYRFRVPVIEKEKSLKDAIAGKSDRSKTGNARTTHQPSLVGGINASLIYDEGEMRIYQLENDEN